MPFVVFPLLKEAYSVQFFFMLVEVYTHCSWTILLVVFSVYCENAQKNNNFYPFCSKIIMEVTIVSGDYRYFIKVSKAGVSFIDKS